MVSPKTLAILLTYPDGAQPVCLFLQLVQVMALFYKLAPLPDLISHCALLSTIEKIEQTSAVET